VGVTSAVPAGEVASKRLEKFRSKALDPLDHSP
jgi:hypothetical protein